MKGILFAGDSFTWGEGLQYYSTLPNVNWDATQHYKEDYTPAHVEFIKSKRFARQVATHFETFEYCRDSNGGDNVQIFQFIDTLNTQWQTHYMPANGSPVGHRMFRMELEDFDYVVVQLTDMFRADTEFTYNGEVRKCNLNSQQSIKTTEFDKYLEETYDGDIKKYMHVFLDTFAKMVEEKFRYYESKGVKKCLIHTWQNELIPYIKNNSFLEDRFIEYNVNGITYSSIWDLQSRNDRPIGMSIHDDPYFQSIGKNVVNGHTSLTAHKIQAEAIINKIEEIEKQVIWQTQNTPRTKML